jgi:putative ABC transport system permease protein
VKLIESLVIAMRSLAVNKLRSALTMLGIIIGVGSVITLMSLGRGAEASITSSYEQLGTNLLQVVPRSVEAEGFAALSPAFSTPSLTMNDVQALQRVRSVTGIAPVNENFVKITYEKESKTSIIHGTTPEYLQVMGYSMAAGQFISERHVGTRANVVVLGSEVARDLFGASEPVGKMVKIKDIRFTVIGVMEERGGAIMGFSFDNIVVVPVTTFQTRLFTQKTPGGEDALASIALKVASGNLMAEATQDVEQVMRTSHRLKADEKNDFSVITQQQVLGIITQITGIFTIFLGAIASISLIVGGIGIMNIMLVSVTERTREIGIRKAVGAKRRDILLQFLLEAAMLSLSGGAVGITGGWLIAFAVSRINFGGIRIPAAVTPDIVLLAVSVSIIIGLASGTYPAVRAGRLNPIDALHYE